LNGIRVVLATIHMDMETEGRGSTAMASTHDIFLDMNDSISLPCSLSLCRSNV